LVALSAAGFPPLLPRAASCSNDGLLILQPKSGEPKTGLEPDFSPGCIALELRSPDDRLLLRICERTSLPARALGSREPASFLEAPSLSCQKRGKRSPIEKGSSFDTKKYLRLAHAREQSIGKFACQNRGNSDQIERISSQDRLWLGDCSIRNKNLSQFLIIFGKTQERDVDCCPD